MLLLNVLVLPSTISLMLNSPEKNFNAECKPHNFPRISIHRAISQMQGSISILERVVHLILKKTILSQPHLGLI